MDNLSKIKAEIERLNNKAISHGPCYCEYEKGYMQGKKDAFARLLSFIESLEKEQNG